MMSELTTKPVNLRNRDAKRIYFEAFTKNERMPYPLMIAMSKLWHTDFLIFYDEKTPVGIIYLAKNRRLVFVMFFALYSNGTVWPKIWEHKNKEKCNET